jgi:flavin reductase (DIM6/NTAB) family NADH-FMN oxidoreductase RutF
MLKPSNHTTCFFTQQVFLIGTYDENGDERFAPVSWISYTNGAPACLIISINGTKRTKSNIERTGLLSATVVTPELLAFAESKNSATANKDSLVNVKTIKGSILDVPLIADSAFSYECQLLKIVELGMTHTYFAEIKKVNIRDDIAKLSFYDLRYINPVIYSPDNYFTVGNHIGRIGDYSKNKLED